MRSLKTSQVRIIDVLASNFQSGATSLNQSQLNISHSELSLTHRKTSKISILPLTRGKIRVTHKSRRRADGNLNGSTSGFNLNSSNSRKQLENPSKSYV
jgi:hypothetical protein